MPEKAASALLAGRPPGDTAADLDAMAGRLGAQVIRQDGPEDLAERYTFGPDTKGRRCLRSCSLPTCTSSTGTATTLSTVSSSPVAGVVYASLEPTMKVMTMSARNRLIIDGDDEWNATVDAILA